MKLKPQFRSVTASSEAVNDEARTVEVAFSSEEPYDRSWGTEILDHTPNAIRLGRLNGGSAVLVDHDPKDHVGVVEKAWIDSDRKARAVLRFGKSQRAEEIFQDVKDGIRSLVSVGYRIHKMAAEKKDSDMYRVLDWEPYEISMVAVPADATVGVGRAADESENEVSIEGNTMTTEVKQETPEVKQAPIDARVIEDARSEERKRVNEIMSISKLHGHRDLADEYINAGKPVGEFQSALLQRMGVAKPLDTVAPAKLDMSANDLKQYSVCRALLAIQYPQDQRLQKEAAHEWAVSGEFQRKFGAETAKTREGALTIPTDVLNERISLSPNEYRSIANTFQRDLNVTTATAGGNLVATDLLSGSFIDILINRMVIMQLGTTMLRDLQGNVAIPRQTAGATMVWVAENAAATEAQAAFDQVTLSPKSAGVFTDYSRRLLLQSSISVETFVRMDLARTMALGIDLAAINGSGASNQPRGVINTAGIGSVAGGTNGLAPTWDHMVDLESAVANANADVSALRYLTNTKVRGKLKRTQMFSGTNGMTVWQAVQDQNAPVAVSNQVPSNLTKGTSNGVCSAILYGNWNDLMIGMWGGLDLLTDPYTGSSARTTRVVAFQDVDVAVRHPESFSAMLDALTV